MKTINKPYLLTSLLAGLVSLAACSDDSPQNNGGGGGGLFEYALRSPTPDKLQGLYSLGSEVNETLAVDVRMLIGEATITVSFNCIDSSKGVDVVVSDSAAYQIVNQNQIVLSRLLNKTVTTDAGDCSILSETTNLYFELDGLTLTLYEDEDMVLGETAFKISD